ncbi:hypothetical protein FRB97_000628 [Tulasnella sp. 331]|nr:hypothetical protein FRB97_000628 [Tulasnella sp. 331]
MASLKDLPPVPRSPRDSLLLDEAFRSDETIRQGIPSPIAFEPEAGPSTLQRRDTEVPRYSEIGHGDDAVELNTSQAVDRKGKQSEQQNREARVDARVEVDEGYAARRASLNTNSIQDEMTLAQATQARRGRIVLDDPRILDTSDDGIEEDEDVPGGNLNELLKNTVKELGSLKKYLKPAVTAEESAQTAYTKAAKAELKLKKIHLKAKAKWEIASAELAAKSRELEVTRERATQQKLQIQEKTRDVERLRTRKAEGDVSPPFFLEASALC